MPSLHRLCLLQAFISHHCGNLLTGNQEKKTANNKEIKQALVQRCCVRSVSSCSEHLGGDL